MCTIGHGSLLPCQNTIKGGIFKKKEKCGKLVRVFNPINLTKLSKFKCQDCLGYSTVHSVCIVCKGMCITNADTGKCFVCNVASVDKENYDDIYEPAIDPNPAPTQKPSTCQSCEVSTEIKWTYNPFDLDVNQRYVYGWWCDDCLYTMSMDI